MTLTDPARRAPGQRAPGVLLLTAAAALVAFIAGCSGAMLAAWAVADVPDLPDRAGVEEIVAAAGLPVDGVLDVRRADHLFGSELGDVPAWVGTDDYGAGFVEIYVRATGEDGTFLSTSLKQQGWREPTRGDPRPRGGLVLLGHDDAGLALQAYVQDEPWPPGRAAPLEGRIAVLEVFRQTPRIIWPVGIVGGALAAAATAALFLRRRELPVGQPGSLTDPLMCVGVALLAPGTLWALVVLLAHGPLFADIGATQPVPVWAPYAWWALKPVSMLGAALCAIGAVLEAAGRRWGSAAAAHSHR